MLGGVAHVAKKQFEQGLLSSLKSVAYPAQEAEGAIRGVAQAMRDDNPTRVVCQTHSISLDWIFDGNLRGRLRTVNIRNGTAIPEHAKGR